MRFKMLTEFFTGVPKLPNRRRYKKSIISTWDKVYYFKFKSTVGDSIKEELADNLKRMRENMGAFYYYHDFSRRRWYVSDEKIATHIKVTYGDKFDRGAGDHAM